MLPDCKLILGVAYIQPKSNIENYNQYLLSAESMVDKYRDHQFIFVGDFNVPTAFGAPIHFIMDTLVHLEANALVLIFSATPSP